MRGSPVSGRALASPTGSAVESGEGIGDLDGYAGIPPPEPAALKTPTWVSPSLRNTGIPRGGRGVLKFFTASSGLVDIDPP